MKLDWRAGLGFIITALLLWWVLHGISLGDLWAEIKDADFLLLGLAVAMATATFFLRALRWKVLLQPIHPGTSLRSRFAAVNIGGMGNNLLPARMGEFARAYALARMEPVPVSGAFGSLVVERFLDALVLVLFLFVAMAAPAFPVNPSMGEWSLSSVIQYATVLLALLLLGMVLMLLFPQAVIRLAERIARFLPGNLSRLVVDSLEAFLDGLRVFQNPGLLFLALLWSLGVWGWQCLAFWVGFRAFGIQVSYDVALFVNSIVAFAVSLPAAPGFFGTFHAGASAGLGVYGVPAAPTLAFAFGFHLGGFIPVTVMGLYSAWKLGLSWGEVEKSEERVEEAVEEAHPELRHRGGKTLPEGPEGGGGEAPPGKDPPC
ncbi:lysylphosphatidylglycerol synthase transmembrane domain-containing protein [Gemmatimonadota bacterium]